MNDDETGALLLYLAGWLALIAATVYTLTGDTTIGVTWFSIAAMNMLASWRFGLPEVFAA